MAVDLLQENERAKGGGMMFGGQLIGTAMATAGTGWAIQELGISGAYLVAAIAVSLVCIYLVCVRERNNERIFPWSPGEAHPRNLEIYLGEWLPILKTTLKSVFQPLSLLWVVFLLTKGAQYGVMTGITPLIGVGEAGLSEAEVTSLTGTAQLVAGLLGLTLGSWMGDRLGVKWSSLILLAAWMTFSGAMFLLASQWSEPAFSPWFITIWVILDTLFSIVTVPVSMRLSQPRVAATQFAIYMAVTNFGISVGTLLLGLSGSLGGLVNLFPILIGFNILGAVILLTVKFPRRQAGT